MKRTFSYLILVVVLVAMMAASAATASWAGDQAEEDELYYTTKIRCKGVNKPINLPIGAPDVYRTDLLHRKDRLTKNYGVITVAESYQSSQWLFLTQVMTCEVYALCTGPSLIDACDRFWIYRSGTPHEVVEAEYWQYLGLLFESEKDNPEKNHPGRRSTSCIKDEGCCGPISIYP